MKCPHCKYKYGTEWVDDELITFSPKEGDFYSLSNKVIMEVQNYREKETMCLKGCPKCFKLFMS